MMFAFPARLLGATTVAMCLIATVNVARAASCSVAIAGYTNCFGDPAAGSGVLHTEIAWNGSASAVGHFAYGNGSFSLASFSVTATGAGYSLLDTYSPAAADPNTGYAVRVLGTGNPPPPGIGGPSSGTWNITPTNGAYSQFLLVFNWGNRDATNPDWVAFALNGIFSGGWKEVGTSEDLIKVYLYGYAAPIVTPNDSPSVAATPLPGAAVLMGTVLAGGAGFGAWRRRRRKAAA